MGCKSEGGQVLFHSKASLSEKVVMVWTTRFQMGVVLRCGSGQSHLVLFPLESVVGKSIEILKSALSSLYFCLLDSKKAC